MSSEKPGAHAALRNGRRRAEPQAQNHIHKLLDSAIPISVIRNEMKEKHFLALTNRDVYNMKYKNEEKEKVERDAIP